MSGIDRKQLEKALSRLGELGIESGVQIELNIYGGSAIILAYDLGRRTRDVDAVFRPRDDVLRLPRSCIKNSKQI